MVPIQTHPAFRNLIMGSKSGTRCRNYGRVALREFGKHMGSSIKGLKSFESD
jgi:hypothetical protein